MSKHLLAHDWVRLVQFVTERHAVLNTRHRTSVRSPRKLLHQRTATPRPDRRRNCTEFQEKIVEVVWRQPAFLRIGKVVVNIGDDSFVDKCVSCVRILRWEVIRGEDGPLLVWRVPPASMGAKSFHSWLQQGAVLDALGFAEKSELAVVEGWSF